MRWQEFLTGRLSKQYLTRIHVPLMICTFIVFHILAMIYYPEPYDLSLHDISYLGAPALNPKGWIYWAIALTITGILYLPLIPYFFRYFNSVSRFWGKLGTIFVSFSAIGMIGLGIFPQYPQFADLHTINATFSFAGMYFTLFSYGISLTRSVLNKDPRISKFIYTIIVGLGYGGPIGWVTTQGIRVLLLGGAFMDHSPDVFFLIRFSLWEWMLLITLLGAFVCLVLIVPSEQKKDDNRIF